MLSGDNSILNQAGRARDITGQREIKERIQLAYLGAIANGTGDVTPEDFKQELIKQFGSDKISDDNITQNADGTFTVTIDGIEANAGESGTTPPPAGVSNLTDGEKTKLPDNGIAELTGDAITNNNLKDTTKIKAVITGEVPIPVDATYEEGTVDTGVVIKYKNSEFVWVPVPVTTENNLYVKGTTKPMAKKTTGKDTNNRDNYQGTLYDYSGTGNSTTSTENTTYVQGTTNFREPDILESTSYGDWSTNSSRGYALIN